MSRRRHQSSRGRRKPAQKKGDYRIFIGAFPQGEVSQQIQVIRESYDLRTSQITAPHVTIAGTYWREGQPNAENEEQALTDFSSLEGTLPAFDVQLGGIRTFGNKVVYLDVVSDILSTTIREALVQTFGKDKHKTFSPHLTLAMRLRPDGVRKMVEELQQTDWETEPRVVHIDALQFMIRGPEDPSWRCLSKISLQTS